eukprot:COSAG01_NODE_8621_length_2716_cov_1.452254_5_plen_264_part_01
MKSKKTRFRTSIESSGLIKIVKKCSIVAVGKQNQHEIFKNLLEKYSDKFTLAKVSPVTSSYERTTLRMIHDEASSSQKNYPILYLHSKGVTRTYDSNLSKNIADWVSLMCYFLIQKHELCLKSLRFFDVCGTNLRSDPELHFHGNFWWASSRYLKNLPCKIGHNYLDPEMWLCMNNPRAVTFFQSGINHYLALYPPKLYQNKPLQVKVNRNRFALENTADFIFQRNKKNVLLDLKAHSCAGLMNSYAMFAQCLNFAKANGYEKI